MSSMMAKLPEVAIKPSHTMSLSTGVKHAFAKMNIVLGRLKLFQAKNFKAKLMVLCTNDLNPVVFQQIKVVLPHTYQSIKQ